MNALQYLQEVKEMAAHNVYCVTKDFEMKVPKDGYEEHFGEYVHKLHLVNEIIQTITEAEQTADIGPTMRVYHLKNHAGHQFRQEAESLPQAKRLLCKRLGYNPEDKDTGMERITFLQAVPKLREVYVPVGAPVEDGVPEGIIEYNVFWSTHDDDDGYVLGYVEEGDRSIS